MRLKVEETNSLTGMILLTSLALLTFGLFTQDINLLWFALPIIFSLIIAISRRSGDIDEAVKSIGISGTNIQSAIPIGIIAGVIVFIIGSFIVTFTDKNTASMIPTFAIASLSPATSTLIPAGSFLAMNLLIQWLIVAPAEELGFRFLAPYIFYSFSKSIPFAILFGTLLWIVEHVPTFAIQGASQGMYIVLLLLGIMSIALIYYTGGIIASWIAHGVFNSLVLIMTGTLNSITYLVIIGIIISLIIIYSKSGGKNAKTQSNFNL